MIRRGEQRAVQRLQTFTFATAGIATFDMLLHPQRSQDSHLIVHAGAADAIALVAPGEGDAPAGTLVEYLPL